MRNTITLCALFSISSMAVDAQLPAGSIARYPFNNSATDASGNSYDGTLVSTSNDVNRFGASNASTAFVAGTSTGTLPSGLVVAMADDFTVAFWFKTGMSAPSSTQWYGGAALVDAEVCGGTSDWGTALINGGQVAFGIGNPDITIISPLSYNDGSWHFLTGTRAEAAGVITLYIDGNQVATTSGTSTAARVAPPFIGLGRNPCVATGAFTGSLDDVIAYNSVLTAGQVTNLYNYYNSVALPIHWGSFTGQAGDGHVHLQWTTENTTPDTRFEVERSLAGADFVQIGELATNSGIKLSSGSYKFDFIDMNPGKGDNDYRVKAVNDDGTYLWTPIVEVSIGSVIEGLHLQTNPVIDKLTLINAGRVPIRRIQVFDISGRVLVDQDPGSGNSLLGINTSALKAGYYFLRVIETGNTAILPFVKLSQ